MWLKSLSITEHVFFWVAIAASALLIVQIVMMLVSFAGGGDLDADGSFDMDGDVDTDSGLAFFSLKAITAFFALGGWCGFAAATYIDNVWAPVLIALATGTVALVGVGFAMKGIAKLQCSGNLVKDKLVGKSATVYVSIPAARSGKGKITLTAQGKYTELDAVTDEKDRIPTGEVVTILSLNEDFAVVAREAQQENEGKKEEI